MSVTIAALPPTVNDLLPDQRTRLLRSTRKLGHVLGATPHVLDNAPLPAGPSKRRNSKLFSHSSSSSQTSLAAITCASSDEHPPIATSSLETRSNSPVPPASGHKRLQSKELPRLLVLRLQSVAPSTAESLVKTLTTSSASSLNLSVPTSLPTRPASTSMLPPSPLPHQDSFSVNDMDKSRRKRMAKLTRTLGENIPTELVFPGHHKSPSEPPLSAITREVRRSDSLNNNAAKKPLPQPPLENTSGYETRSAPQRSESLVISRANVQRSRSLTVGAQPAAARRVPRKRSPQRIPEEPPFASIRNPAPVVDQIPQRSWDGEWSIQDADKRAMVLRNLKSR